MTPTLTKSADIQGAAVVGLDGAKLGTARELFIDLATGTVAFVVAEGAGLLGGSGKFHPVPWASVRYDPIASTFQVEVTKDVFKASPSYDREQLANPSFGWDEQASKYFAGLASA
jgi:sporulation protein YlmC with PRC-barrel domain